MTAAILLVALIAVPAARVDDRVVTTAVLDEASQGRADALRARIAKVAREGAWRLVDERLERTEAPRGAASDEELAARRGTVPLLVDADTTERALRWQIEEEHRESDARAARLAARAQAGARLAELGAADLETALPPGRTVAWLGDETIGSAELERALALPLYRLRGELHRERERRLREAIDEELLRAEAERRGLELRDLVEAPSVSDEEVELYLAGRAGDGGSGMTRERVRPLLESRARHAAREALLRALRERASIVVLLEPPAPPVVDAADADAPTLGPHDAPEDRTVVLFGSYRDALSRRVHAALDQVREAAPDVKIVLRDFTVGFDPGAEEAARLVRCAAAHGSVAKARRELLGRTPPSRGAAWYGAEERDELARRIDAEPGALARCLVEAEVGDRVRADTQAARRLGFDAPPALVVAGRPMSGLQSAGTVVDALGPPSD